MAEQAHIDLLTKLDGELDKDSLKKLKVQCRTLDPPLTIKELETIKSADDLWLELEKKGHLPDGNYHKLKTLFYNAKLHRCVEIIEQHDKSQGASTGNKSQPATSSSYARQQPKLKARPDRSSPQPKAYEGEDESDSGDEGDDELGSELDVDVVPCTEKFYKAHTKNAYAMYKEKRGQALIINVKNVVTLLEREGTDVDRKNLVALCEGLGFEVKVCNDDDGLKGEEIEKKIEEFANADNQEESQATVVFLLSHGGDGFICGTDKSVVKISKVIELMDSKNLKKKPKLLFTQACRGKKYGEEEYADGDDVPHFVASRQDFFRAFATQRDHKAWRSAISGSRFIVAVVKVFMENAATKDICQMMHLVNDLIGNTKREKSMCQMPEYTSTLTKESFYFFPGIISKPEEKKK